MIREGNIQVPWRLLVALNTKAKRAPISSGGVSVAGARSQYNSDVNASTPTDAKRVRRAICPAHKPGGRNVVFRKSARSSPLSPASGCRLHKLSSTRILDAADSYWEKRENVKRSSL